MVASRLISHMQPEALGYKVCINRCSVLVQALFRYLSHTLNKSVAVAELAEDEVLEGGKCGLKDSQPPTGGVGPVGVGPVGALALPHREPQNLALSLGDAGTWRLHGGKPPHTDGN